MKEIEANKEAWGLLSQEHYQNFKTQFADGTFTMNRHIVAELGDVRGKRIIHLQCNTGADTIWLARQGARVTGVDLVPENIRYARQLAGDLGQKNVDFFECDIMELADKHVEKYDMVFASEGAIGWLPDMARWGQTVRHLLRENGFLYVFDNHPFYMAFDEKKFADGILEIKYPYFNARPDKEESIGGYAAEPRPAEAYFWMHKVSDILNGLAGAGMRLEYFHEFTENFWDAGGMDEAGGGLFAYEFNADKIPMSFSLKATVLSIK